MSAMVEEVVQGEYCKMSIVGTVNWHYDMLFWNDYPVNNIFNLVMIWLTHDSVW